LRFLCIASTNLDEFFEIRAARLKQQLKIGAGQTGADNMSPIDVLTRISVDAHKLVDEQYRVLNDVLIPAMRDQNIRFVRRTPLNPKTACLGETLFQQ